MSLHTTTGRRTLGFALSFFTAFLWGILPIALKAVLEKIDAYTITWYRLLVSAVLLGVLVIRRNGLPGVSKFRGPVKWLVSVAVLGLCGNYILYLLGLDFLTPSTAVVVVQLAPVFLLIGGLIVFKENFSAKQYAGFGVLVLGLLLFFNQRLGEFFHDFSDYTVGVLLIIGCSFVWAAYALAQKQLLKVFPSSTIMLIIYLGGSLLFLPLTSPSTITGLSPLQLALLAFCALNTFFAYGSFSEALNHLEASRVSAVLAVIPLITIAGMKMIEILAPNFLEPENLNFLSILGAFFVVIGSALASLSRSE